MDKETLDALYQQETYYWGKAPSQLAQKAMSYLSKGKSLVDLGAGEGRDGVFFAEQGLEVVAVDISSAGLKKAKRLVQENGLDLQTIQADVNHLKIPFSTDVIYSIGALQYLEPQRRQQQFQHIQAQTNERGIHILFAFVEHPDVEIAPDWGKNEYLYQKGELLSYYPDWEVLYEKQLIFDCQSSGVPHRHAAEILIVKSTQAR